MPAFHYEVSICRGVVLLAQFGANSLTVQDPRGLAGLAAARLDVLPGDSVQVIGPSSTALFCIGSLGSVERCGLVV